MSDPTGNEYTGARAISDSLSSNGCLLGGYPSAQTEDISANPVFDAARRFSRFYRVIRHQELLSYEVDADGARLRFRRNAWGVTGADAWLGIAPPAQAIPSGELTEGEEYIVHGTTGGVTYAGERFPVGKRFTATGAATYVQDGDAEPWVYDGVRHTALKKGWTNEWLVVLQTHVFKEQYDSIWKPEVYADHYAWGERALFMIPSADVALLRHANTTTAFSVDPVDGKGTWEQELTRAQFINPEAPSSYRYTLGANSTASTEFKKSCQVYERPMEVWSCTLEHSGPVQIVVVHLRDRPRCHANAPSYVDADPTAWSADDLARLDGTHATDPEDYRTLDNAIREWLRWAFGDHKAPSLKTGDHAYSGSPYPVPWGNCVPTFHLVKCIPEAYEDDNETMDASDSRMLAETHQQAEWYLRAMCEGFVDGETSIARTCRNASDAGLYDYTWENACYESHTGRDCGPFPVSVREDRPAGFGPLPNTKTYAEVHNRLAGVVNLLTKLRLEVPLEWSTRDITSVGDKDVGLDAGTWGLCTDSTFEVWVDNQKPPSATIPVSTSAWTVSSSAPVLQGTQSVGLACDWGGSFEWHLQNYRLDTEWKVEIESTWLDAVPVELQELVTIGSVGSVAERQELRQRYKRLTGTPTECDGSPGTWEWEPRAEIDNEVTCVAISPGVVASPLPPSSDFGTHKPPGSDACNYGSIHSITWALLAWPGAFVTVPLVDLP